MNPAFFLSIALAAALQQQPAKPNPCPAPWAWDGGHCFIQSKAAQDPIQDAADEARLAYWLALRRAYDAGQLYPAGYAWRSRRR